MEDEVTTIVCKCFFVLDLQALIIVLFSCFPEQVLCLLLLSFTL